MKLTIETFEKSKTFRELVADLKWECDIRAKARTLLRAAKKGVLKCIGHFGFGIYGSWDIQNGDCIFSLTEKGRKLWEEENKKPRDTWLPYFKYWESRGPKRHAVADEYNAF
jgi:hypothetical protein